MRTHFWGALICSLFCVSCVRTCLGQSELGSKSNPLKILTNLSIASTGQNESLKVLSECMESYIGFRVMFEQVSNDEAVAQRLQQGNAHGGVFSPLGAAEAEYKYDFVHEVTFTPQKSPQNRIFFVGNFRLWNAILSKSQLNVAPFWGLVEGLERLTGSSIIYQSKTDPVDFLVPRHLLLQADVFPGSAYFVSSGELVLQAIEQETGLVGVIREIQLIQSFPEIQNKQLSLGQKIHQYVVLGISPSLPGSILSTPKSLHPKIRGALISGLRQCASRPELESIFTDYFGGSHSAYVAAKNLEIFREIHTLQENMEERMATDR